MNETHTVCVCMHSEVIVIDVLLISIYFFKLHTLKLTHDHLLSFRALSWKTADIH